MQEVVGVKFREASKVYFFDGNNILLKKGDRVLVDTSGGESVGIIAEELKKVEDKEIEEPLKKVIRKLTEADLKKLETLKEKANSKLPIIEEKIAGLNLDMNIVEVEYSFDETKITISYTSEGRVDFRELLKVLASALRVKIELRQIGTRDEVKIIGGLGLCGMPCCCTRFLKEPEHVTVKMVKNQNLSMSPTKTGGLCGRMMCCLAYEDKQYKELISNLPSLGSFVTMPNGTAGTVSSHDVLGQKFTLKVVYNDGSFKFKEFSLQDLKPETEVETLPEKEQEDAQVQEKTETIKQEPSQEEHKQDNKQNKKKHKYFNKFNKKNKNKKENN